MTQRSELRVLTKLGLDELGDAASGVHSVHRAISDRVFTFVPVPPVKWMHDVITDGVYEIVAGASRATGLVAEAAVPDLPPVSDTVRGGVLLGILQGLIGDKLPAELTARMTVRVDGKPVADVAQAFPGATGRLVVFVHGLVETEHAWRLGGRPAYGERLAADLGMTPVYVRYNTGRHISENGRELAALLEALVAAWPVPVAQIALVGHSMGAMVARSACHQAPESYWVRRVHHVVCLGSPHLGAPLEQFVHYASAVLAAVPETRAFGALLRRRSAGIRDLRAGSLVDEDWRDRDADALAAAVCAEVPLLTGAAHFFVSATVTRSPRHPLGRLIGDGLVLVPSASGRSRRRRIGFDEADGFHIGGASHFTLLNNDAVYEQLRSWLRAPVVV